MSRRTVLMAETRPPSEPPSKLWWLMAVLLIVIVLPDFGWRHQTIDWLKDTISAFDNTPPPAPPIASPPSEKSTPQAPQLTVALDANNRCMVDLTLNGIGPFRFIVDTGAEGVILNASMGRRLGIDLRKLAPDHGSGGWGGGRTDGVFVRLDEIRLNSFRLRQFEVAVENETSFSEGLAGITFIRQLHRFEVRDGQCRFWW